jgi:16S rRNA (uracil1498-N3)-methyltransferase
VQLFYAKKIGDEYFLEKEEFRHATQVLRHKTGDIIFTTDGLGNLYEVEIKEIQKQQALLVILKKETISPNKPKIHLVIAPTKNLDRIEWMVEKCTEIGIGSIHFIICSHSERKTIKTERIQKIIVAACKQSKQYTFPEIVDAVTFTDFIKNMPDAAAGYICTCAACDVEINQLTAKVKEEVFLLIGPEGDFTQLELNLAKDAGFESLSLGKSRLRTETAAIVALSQLQLLYHL